MYDRTTKKGPLSMFSADRMYFEVLIGCIAKVYRRSLLRLRRPPPPPPPPPPVDMNRRYSVLC